MSRALSAVVPRLPRRQRLGTRLSDALDMMSVVHRRFLR
jgi:hypothetical protein